MYNLYCISLFYGNIIKYIDIITYDGCMNNWIQTPTCTCVKQTI